MSHFFKMSPFIAFKTNQLQKKTKKILLVLFTRKHEKSFSLSDYANHIGIVIPYIYFSLTQTFTG